MIRVCLVGFGKMGSEFFSYCQKSEEVKIVSVIDESKTPQEVQAFKTHCVEAFENCDVAVDFSSKEGLQKTVEFACNKKIPVVSGVTGLTRDELEELKNKVASSGNKAIFAANFSFGVNVFLKTAREMARMLPDYDAQVIEMHHVLKKDSPSGTGLKLARVVEEGRGLEKGQVAISSIRVGDIFGDHKVVFASLGEHLELSHSAHSRACFARGAIDAVRFIYEQEKPGIYSIEQVFGL